MSSVSTRPHPDTASKQSRAKSDNAFRTISEVAEELHVPQHVLRFWETRFAQVKPMKRGGNRRYYRPEDVDLLRAIRGLLYEDGYTIKGVQKLFRERGVRATVRGYLGAAAGAFQPPAPDGYDETDQPAAATASALASSGPVGQTASAELRQVIDELKALKRMLDDAGKI